MNKASDMKRRVIWLWLCLSVSFIEVLGQVSLEEFNSERQSIDKKGMLVLGSWAMANIISSPILASQYEGSSKYFYRMNGYWNGVNLLIAGLGYYKAVRGNAMELSLSEAIKEQHRTEKVLLFNAGLDLAYITGGLYLKARAKNSKNNRDRLTGFGNSLMLQGGVLFAFDVVFHMVHQKHSHILFDRLESLYFTPGGAAVVWRI